MISLFAMSLSNINSTHSDADESPIDAEVTDDDSGQQPNDSEEQV
jgi:hypothetical protein